MSEDNSLSVAPLNGASEAATTGSGVVKPARRINPRKPITELKPDHKLLIEYMVSGCPHDWVSQYTRHLPTPEDPDRRVTLQPGWPLSLEEAADVLRIRRRHARFIASQKVFQAELAKSLQAMREGAKANALRRVIALVDEQGEGKAADRKVQLQAAQAILGEAVGNPDKASVNVTVNTGPQIRAGVVIRLRPDIPPTPLEQQMTDITDQAIEE